MVCAHSPKVYKQPTCNLVPQSIKSPSLQSLIFLTSNRCLKCQKFSHHIPDCKAEQDTCACCSGNHHTMQCVITDQAAFSCVNCVGETAKGHRAADRNCSMFTLEKGKVDVWVPENKYKFFPTAYDSQLWKLLTEPTTQTELQHQTPQYNMRFRPPNTDTRHQQHFMEDWQTVQQQWGKHHTSQGKWRGVSHNVLTRTNTGTADNGWLTGPAQTTLENYFQNPMVTQNQVQWGDQDDSTGITTQTERSHTNREPTPLKYIDAWKPTRWDQTKTHSSSLTKHQQIAHKSARLTGKSETQHIWHLRDTGTIHWSQWQVTN